MRKSMIALVVLTGLSAAAQANAMEPGLGYSIELGSMSGTAYYTIEEQGFHVVAIIAGRESGKPVRVNTVLGPNQRLRLAVPAPLGADPVQIEFVREGDRIVIWKQVVAIN